ncbi:MAG TPA: N-acetylmuramoyl-L-alanine amidase [Candidatus Udaeobacter sp.]|nr:N-acetylmuramoyl-L-alanine amidase [Candidatus Udaeobacter sp.]
MIVACIVWFPRLVEAFRATEQQVKPPPQQLTAGGQLQVSGLDAGACMSFAATASATGKTVFVDPGHGGLDPGVVGSSGGRQVLEKDATLAVATRLASLLRGDGYRVVLARTADTSAIKLSPSDSVTGSLTDGAEHRDLVTRATCANAANASVLVSIHFDGFVDPSVGGTETFYDAARPFSNDNKRLALDLQGALVTGLGTSDRGVWPDDQVNAPTLTTSGSAYGHLIELGPQLTGWVDDPSRMPGALVEPLFITHPQEARIAADPAGQQQMAVALEAGLQKYFSGA